LTKALCPAQSPAKHEEVAVPGKRAQFDDETWAAIDALARREGKNFQELTTKASPISSRNIASRSALKPP
jgi:hypothetical protein